VVGKDDLSLLSNLTGMERARYRGKGIFTVSQLACTCRPRRRSKRLAAMPERYRHALKALAIREQKIHVVGKLELPMEGTPVVLNVEGLPDRDSSGPAVGDLVARHTGPPGPIRQPTRSKSGKNFWASCRKPTGLCC
jgi:hypothetical protein